MVKELPLLKMYLLGPATLECSGKPLNIPRRQVRALLYLLGTRLQSIPRDRLTFLFWPDTPDSVARRNLSHLLTHLRSVLPIPRVLQTSGDHVYLNSQTTWSDTVTFEQLCQPGKDKSGLESPQQAAELYRGPFLSGFSLPGCAEFEKWLLLEQRNFEQRYLEVLFSLVERWSATGNYSKAITCALHYLELNELDEKMHRHLISLHAAVGDRMSALRQFERCTVILERELGVMPLPETRSIYQSVLEGQLPNQQLVLQELTWTTLPSLEIPLVGRSEGLCRLDLAYSKARASQGCFVLIRGEAGIGKSRLMQDFATHLRGEALLLAGACQVHEQTLPYQPIAQALRSTLSVENYAFKVKPIWLAEASRLLPELHTIFPDLPSPSPAEPLVARLRMFEALTQMILGVVNGPLPVVFCIDDLQYADISTLDWLVYLSQRISERRLLVVCAYRPEEAEAVLNLRHALGRAGILSEIYLAGLDTDSISELLHYFTGPISTDGGFTEHLQKATGGNPYFLLEILRALSEAGRLGGDLSPLSDLPLPDTIRKVVTARLQRLSPVSRQILEAAAILGSSFDCSLIHLTAGRTEMEVTEGLEELISRQLLVVESEVRSGSGGVVYRFQHEITRRVVEMDLSPMRRQLLQYRAGLALEQLNPDMIVALAYHFEAGGETKRAIHYHHLAVKRAQALFAWQEAERHQGRILDLLAWLDPDCSQPAFLIQRGQILIERAHHRNLLGQLAERDADLTALVELAKKNHDSALHLQASLHRINYLNLDAQYAKAIEEAKLALKIADRSNIFSVQTLLLNQIGFAYYFLGQPRQALAVLEPSLAALSEYELETRRHLMHTLGYVYFHMGKLARSLAYQQEAKASHEQVGDDNGAAWAGLDIGAIYLEMGQLAEARQYLSTNLDLARRVGARSAEAYGLAWSGYCELYEGNYLSALDNYYQALSLEQELRSVHGRVAAEEGIGLVFLHLGDLAQARYWLELAVDHARPICHLRRLVKALIGLGLVEIAASRPFAALPPLVEAVRIARESECYEGLASGLCALARARRLGDDVEHALEHAQEAIGIAQKNALITCEIWGEMEVGLALLGQDMLKAALEHTRRAIGLISQAHEGWIGCEEVYFAHARILQGMGESEAACEYINRAREIMENKANCIADPDLREQYLHTRIDW